MKIFYGRKPLMDYRLGDVDFNGGEVKYEKDATRLNFGSGACGRTIRGAYTIVHNKVWCESSVGHAPIQHLHNQFTANKPEITHEVLPECCNCLYNLEFAIKSARTEELKQFRNILYFIRYSRFSRPLIVDLENNRKEPVAGVMEKMYESLYDHGGPIV